MVTLLPWFVMWYRYIILSPTHVLIRACGYVRNDAHYIQGFSLVCIHALNICQLFMRNISNFWGVGCVVMWIYTWQLVVAHSNRFKSYVHFPFLATLRSKWQFLAIFGNFWWAFLLTEMQNIARNGKKVTEVLYRVAKNGKWTYLVSRQLYKRWPLFKDTCVYIEIRPATWPSSMHEITGHIL